MSMDMSMKSYSLPLPSDNTSSCFIAFFSEITCKDNAPNPKENCRVMGSGCGTAVSDVDAFAMAKTDYKMCLK